MTPLFSQPVLRPRRPAHLRSIVAACLLAALTMAVTGVHRAGRECAGKIRGRQDGGRAGRARGERSFRCAMTTPAREAILVDATTGAVLFEKDPDALMPPASMSKMMTAYLVFQRLKDGRLKLDDTLPVSENAWRTGGSASGGSTMFLKLGDQVPVEDLIRGIIVQSGNDASIVIAEGLAGSEAGVRRADDQGGA